LSPSKFPYGEDPHAKRFLVGVTGAQGVGKSTFCSALADRLNQRDGLPCTVLAGLGAAVKERGYVLGSGANQEGVLAVMGAHLTRQRLAPDGIVVLDRCPIDMLAYVRTLNLDNGPLLELATEIAHLFVSEATTIIYLQISDLFVRSPAGHETNEFRLGIDRSISEVLSDLAADPVRVCADDPGAMDRVCKVIESRLSGVGPEQPNG
jgi:predicted ATPase